MGDPILFIILALVAVAAAVAMVLSQNAVHSALFLVLNFITIAILYIILNAPFIAMVQITVYAGAIMVLFLFVIMLLGAERLPFLGGNRGWQFGLAVLLALVALASFVYLLVEGDAIPASAAASIDSSPANLGLRLFESYVFPFELTGILLLVAMIGVVVLGGRRQARGTSQEGRAGKRGNDA